MTAPLVLPVPAGADAFVPLTAARRATGVRLLRVRGEARLTTGDEETAAVLLAGTFDLVGGGTSWPARGARTTPFLGRPMAVFLPPRTAFAAGNGHGEIVLIAARQPPAPAPATGREAFGSKPLLPLAGSGKAFDPLAGEWKPAETFATAAESLPPRRFQQLAVGGIPVERIFAADYKAATLGLDEAVLPAHATLRLADLPGTQAADEVVLFVRAPRGATVVDAGGRVDLAGDAVVTLQQPAGRPTAVVTAGDDPAYVLLAHLGK